MEVQQFKWGGLMSNSKTCNVCHTVKPLSEYHKNSDCKDGHIGYCKMCVAKQNLARNRTKEGLIRELYRHQKLDSKRKNTPLPNYSLQYLLDTFLSDEEFNLLHSLWVKSNYNPDLKPVIRRKNHYIGFSKVNIELSVWADTKAKSNFNRVNGLNNKASIAVNQFDLADTLLATFHSIGEAGRQLNLPAPHISMACKGKLKTVGGYKFQAASVRGY